MPFEMQKRSRNSYSFSSSVGFSEPERLELTPAQTTFLPLPAALDEATSFFVGMMERWAKLDLHSTMSGVRKEPPDPTTQKAVPQDT